MLKLLILLGLCSCANNRNVPLGPPPPLEMNSETTLEEIKKSLGGEEKCRILGDRQYCTFLKDEKIYVFKNGKFEDKIVQPKEGLTYLVTVVTKGITKKTSERGYIYLSFTDKALKKELYPFIASIFEANGFRVLPDKKNHREIAVSYGYLEKRTTVNYEDWGDETKAKRKEEVTRFLTLREPERGWHLTATSKGYLKNLKRVVPVLATAASDSFANASQDLTVSGRLKDNSLEVITFKDFSQRRK